MRHAYYVREIGRSVTKHSVDQILNCTKSIERIICRPIVGLPVLFTRHQILMMIWNKMTFHRTFVNDAFEILNQ